MGSIALAILLSESFLTVRYNQNVTYNVKGLAGDSTHDTRVSGMSEQMSAATSLDSQLLPSRVFWHKFMPWPLTVFFVLSVFIGAVSQAHLCVNICVSTHRLAHVVRPFKFVRSPCYQLFKCIGFTLFIL